LKKTLTPAVILALIVVAFVVPIQPASAGEPDPLGVGDEIRVESVRGIAHDSDTDKTMKATLVLTLTVTEIDKAHAKFKVSSGQITVDDYTYTITSGAGRAIVRKFGWIIVGGKATLTTGELFEFRLEGMLHIERPRLVLAGLFGGIRDENGAIRLRFIAKLSRT